MFCFALAVFVYGAVCVSILRQSVVWLLGYVADDGFYYLQIARHLAAGQGPTFDGLHPTNGFHPGWMALMTLCARVVHGNAALLRTALAVALACHLATSVILATALRRLVSPAWAWLLAAAWLLNPLPLTLALYGVEAAFTQLTVVVAVWAYLALLAPFLARGVDFLPPTRHLALFGLSLALAFYGRTDQALLALLAVMWLLAAIRRGTAPKERGRAARRLLGWTGGVFVLAAAPWYVFSFATCGTLAQDSGAIKMLWHFQPAGVLSLHGLILAPLKFAALFWLAAPFHALLTGGFPGSKLRAAVTLLLLLLWLGWAAREAAQAARQTGDDAAQAARWLGLAAWLGTTLLVAGLGFGLLINDPQFWYLAVPSLALFLLAGTGAARLLSRRAPMRLQAAAGAALMGASLLLCLGHRLRMTAPYPWQRDVFLSQPGVERLVPAGASLGCFDAGIPAYFSARPIVNLDGLVNHPLVAYWKRHALEQGLAAQNIGYIVNEPGTLHHALLFMQSPPPLTVLARFPLRGWSHGPRTLWKVGRPRPARPGETALNIR